MIRSDFKRVIAEKDEKIKELEDKLKFALTMWSNSVRAPNNIKDKPKPRFFGDIEVKEVKGEIK